MRKSEIETKFTRPRKDYDGTTTQNKRVAAVLPTDFTNL
jgi:hypothetical protein